VALVFEHLKFYLRGKARSRKHTAEIPRTCRRQRRGSRLLANLNAGKSRCSRAIRNNRSSRNPGPATPGSAKFRSPQRDAHKKIRATSRVALYGAGVSRAGDEEQQAAAGLPWQGLAAATANICFAMGENARTTWENSA